MMNRSAVVALSDAVEKLSALGGAIAAGVGSFVTVGRARPSAEAAE